MNALPPHRPPEPLAHSASASTWIDAGWARSLVGRFAALYAALALALLGLLATPSLAGWAMGPGGVCAGAILLPLAGLLATYPLTAARSGVVRRRLALPRRLARWRRPEIDADLRLARLARRPQGVIVPAIGLCAVALVASFPARGEVPLLSVPVNALLLGAVAIVLGFPLLLAERIMASIKVSTLPETEALRALLFVPVAVIPLAGLLEIGASLGVPFTRVGFGVLAVVVGVIGAELAVRALANWFLPPPDPLAARAAVTSLAAMLLQPARLAPDGLAAPIRTHLGLDFSRSWALRFARSAALPIGLALGVIAWGLTGITLIELDKRGIYERFGEPSAVWAPGLHAGLPWPLGRVRRVDLGLVHAVTLGSTAMADASSPAEAAAPPGADRLWDQVHPSEVAFLLASRETDGRQGFQTVNVDMKVLYRIGLDDASARAASYAIDRPETLVRAETGRLVAGVLAGTELADVLGAGRARMEAGLRTRLQSELDRLGGGIELMAVVIEAIHPPPAAADAYHNVQAAQIVAETAISTERGRALAASARARQQTVELTAAAEGGAAETVGQAQVAATAFAADRAAAQVGGEAFLLERYFGTLSTALPKAPLVIVDHRLVGADAPTIDLRSFGAAARTPTDD